MKIKAMTATTCNGNHHWAYFKLKRHPLEEAKRSNAKMIFFSKEVAGGTSILSPIHWQLPE